MLPFELVGPPTSFTMILILCLQVGVLCCSPCRECVWSSIDGLYERLMQIPESFLNADMQAIIIPAFEIYPKLKVDRRAFRNEWERIKPRIPGNKTALAACMNTKKKDCIIFRDKSHLHVCE